MSVCGIKGRFEERREDFFWILDPGELKRENQRERWGFKLENLEFLK